ncbi:MAG: polysaccharide biosynthesis/export family protein [Prosthecobacter sp.]
MTTSYRAWTAASLRRIMAAGLSLCCCLAGNFGLLKAEQPTKTEASQANAGSANASQQLLATSSDYQIREGDMVQVSVFNEPELAAGGRVRNDGSIQCPLIGSMRIIGLTQTSAARLIEEAYRKDYLVNPEVNLFVSQFSTRRITVLGQVQRPGSHDLPAEKNLTILQVLGLAGGTTRIANLKKVMVKRVVGGREQIIKVDVHSMASGARTMMFYVNEDDVITVPESFF